MIRSEEVELTGWGGINPVRSNLVTADTTEELVDVWCSADAAGVIARGSGRSYGDASQSDKGTVVDMKPFAQILAFDPDAGTVDVEAGCTLRSLLEHFLPMGWSLPVLPGTSHVTVGGAIASDVHGKNHESAGSFSRHVLSMDVICGSGGVVTLLPGSPEFQATAGGMGLTGIILRARLALQKLTSPQMVVTNARRSNLDDIFSDLAEHPGDATYSVAWVDVLARGSKLGRGIITTAEHSTAQTAFEPVSLASRVRFPKRTPAGMLNRVTVRGFNEAYYRLAATHSTSAKSLPSYMFPLDAVDRWDRAYGQKGFFQYQFVVPIAAADCVYSCLHELQTRHVPGFLAVLKRLGAGVGLMSFPIPGWCFAVDIPATLPGIDGLLSTLDRMVVEAGGRVYLSKDARVPPEMFKAMYPELDKWRAIRDGMDPAARARSDLSGRLQLVSR